MTPPTEREAAPSMHPDVAPFEILIGTWEGRGHGVFPTIEPFDYDETVTFSHLGKPFVAYAQRTFHQPDGRPLHCETGYLRLPRPDWAELVISHPTGVVEVEEGSFGGSSLRLRSRIVACTGSAKHVAAIERDIDVRDDVIAYTLRMAAVGEPLTEHLVARLHRV
jgi:hypothetical protein